MRPAVRPVESMGVVEGVAVVTVVPVTRLCGGGVDSEDRQSQPKACNRDFEEAATVPTHNRHRRVPHDLALGADAPKQHGRGNYAAVITCRLSGP